MRFALASELCSSHAILPTMKILLIGATGQLAQDIRSAFTTGRQADEVIAITHEQLDIRNADAVQDAVQSNKPDWIVNTAAFHKVDLCEDEPETTFAVNEGGVANLARAAQRSSARLLQFSTDYVFDGKEKSPYLEKDEARPISVYGESRLAGERAVQQNCERHLIVRTCGLYGLAGRHTKLGNFVETMLRLAASKKSIRVVSDQICTPTSTRDLAQRLIPMVRNGAQGLFHMTNNGECSWFQFAQEIFRLAQISAELAPVTSAEYAAKAQRPVYSVLENAALRAAGFDDFDFWQETLEEYINEREKLQ